MEKANRKGLAKRKISKKRIQSSKDAYHSSSESDAAPLDSIDLSDNESILDDEYDIDEDQGDADDADSQDNDDTEGGPRTSKMALAISKILEGSAGPEGDARPILSKKRHLETEIDNEMLTEKARKVLSSERKLLKSKGRVIPDHTSMDYEKKLRKVATRGVVQLFNAIRVAQNSVKELQNDAAQKKSAEIPAVSKETFIKSLKQDSQARKKQKTDLESKLDDKTKGNKDTAEPSNVAWLASDFALKPQKHWDEEEEDEEAE